MGTVHAKENNIETNGDMFRKMEQPIQKPTIKLDGVRARVDRVHVDGLNRTKDDIVKSTVDELFQASDFEDVIVRAHKVRRALDSMGCFRDIGVFIDVSSGPGSTPEGLEVTFQVQELSRIVGGINTTVSENEGNVVIGMKMPNVLGRGEKLQAEYSMGHRSNSNFSITTIKPYPHKALVPVLSASVFQQNHDYPWSGYRLLDRGVLADIAFKTSPNTKHNIQWEGIIRETSMLSKLTSFPVRECSGVSMKSIFRHIVSVERRDDPIFPNRGLWVQFQSEFAGLGGGVAYLKNELHAENNVSLAEGVVIQLTGSMGVLYDIHGTDLTSHLYLGGPTTLRGFKQRGVGPHVDGFATGGVAYWCSGIHLYTPLPFQPGKGGIGDLFRTHFFINGGSIAPPAGRDENSESSARLWQYLSASRVSYGVGIALRLGRAARAELNYCFVGRAGVNDRGGAGLQLGLGAHFA